MFFSFFSNHPWRLSCLNSLVSFISRAFGPRNIVSIWASISDGSVGECLCALPSGGSTRRCSPTNRVN